MTSFEIAFGDIVVFAFTIPVGVFILEAIARSAHLGSVLRHPVVFRIDVGGVPGACVRLILNYIVFLWLKWKISFLLRPALPARAFETGGQIERVI